MLLSNHVLGQKIKIQAERLDTGWDVSLFGGIETHVGSVTIAHPDGSYQTLEVPGHRESVITERWAPEMARILGGSVCLRSGVYYPDITNEQGMEILNACDEMLTDVTKVLYYKQQQGTV